MEEGSQERRGTETERAGEAPLRSKEGNKNRMTEK